MVTDIWFRETPSWDVIIGLVGYCRPACAGGDWCNWRHQLNTRWRWHGSDYTRGGPANLSKRDENTGEAVDKGKLERPGGGYITWTSAPSPSPLFLVSFRRLSLPDSHSGLTYGGLLSIPAWPLLFVLLVDAAQIRGSGVRNPRAPQSSPSVSRPNADEVPPEADELHRLWRDHVGIRPRYTGRGASASRSLTSDNNDTLPSVIGHVFKGMYVTWTRCEECELPESRFG
ncbi:hypothetical protein Bbelb_158720 [Branchiostoma belcheri]|nr:hypothetical protein Bbelb_158720 [Branchiostoma belcheri]